MALQLANLDGIKVENRISSNGRNLGQVLAFNSQGSPSQIRAIYRAAGLTGNKLSAATREAVKAERDIAWVKFNALAQMAQNDDFIPSVGKINSKGDKMSFELVKPAEVKATAKPPVDPEQAVADRMGISVEDLRKLYIKK
jgi:hypothetical protein